MSDMVTTMIRRLLKREPTDQDYRRTGELMADLPPEILSSPAAVADIVLRAEYLRKLEEIIRKATWDAQQRINDDTPGRVDKAALRALDAIRDHLPIDAADRMGRLLKLGAIWTLMVITIAGAGGAILTDRLAAKDRKTHHAFNDRDFNRCVDAITVAFQPGAGTGSRVTPTNIDHVRKELGICAAEYADRRAGFS